MSQPSGRHLQLERRLAVLLYGGTWIGSLVVAAGIVLQIFQGSVGAASPAGARLVNAGVVLFILLPMLRLLVMLVVFARERDYRYASIAALVLAIIAVGAVLGWRLAAAGA